MYPNPELEKITKKYLRKVRSYEGDFVNKSIDELKKLRTKLKPNFFQYIQAIFSDSNDRLIKLTALEQVIKQKEKTQ